MKKALVIGTFLASSIGLLAQPGQPGGTVVFANRNVPVGLDAPVFDQDGVTKLAGDAYLAGLYAAATMEGIDLSTAPYATTPFRLNGYVSGGTVTLGELPQGTAAWFQVAAWEASGGATLAEAIASGSLYGVSTAFEVVTGAPGASPPGLPAPLAGMQSFSLVPEPTTFVLGLFGGVALMMRRRR